MLGNPSATAHHPFRIIHANFAASIHNHTTHPRVLHHFCFGCVLQRTFLFSLKHEKLNLDLRSEWLCLSCAICGVYRGQAGPDSTDVSLNKPAWAVPQSWSTGKAVAGLGFGVWGGSSHHSSCFPLISMGKADLTANAVSGIWISKLFRASAGWH